MRVQKSKREFVRIDFTLDEMTSLHRMVCSGLMGGNSRVLSALYTKIERANEFARMGKSVIITIDGKDYESHGEETKLAV